MYDAHHRERKTETETQRETDRRTGICQLLKNHLTQNIQQGSWKLWETKDVIPFQVQRLRIAEGVSSNQELAGSNPRMCAFGSVQIQRQEKACVPGPGRPGRVASGFWAGQHTRWSPPTRGGVFCFVLPERQMLSSLLKPPHSYTCSNVRPNIWALTPSQVNT